MKLWKKTVILMLATLLCSLLLVGGLTLFITGKRSLENAAQTYGKQLQASAGMMERFWDNGKYERMTEIGKRSYLEFQFRQCFGEGYILFETEQNQAIENLTAYSVVNITPMDRMDASDVFDYRIQRLPGRELLLQQTEIQHPANHRILSVRDITDVFTEIRRLGLWFMGIYSVIFVLAGLFIYRMMRKTVQRMEELQEVAGKQELLLGALAHEMKTPLTAIIGYADTLIQVKLKEEQKERALSHISREGRRLEALSGKMLQMLGLYRNQAIHMKEASIGDLICRVEELELPSVSARRMQLRTEYEDFQMCMDFELLESLLLNLVDNAVHASGKGDVIWIRAFCDGRKKILQVEDGGRGIPKEELLRVTEAFYMVDKSRSRREGGAGRGLALCMKIVQLHHGDMEIRSEPGEGTTVTVSFS